MLNSWDELGRDSQMSMISFFIFEICTAALSAPTTPHKQWDTWMQKASVHRSIASSACNHLAKRATKSYLALGFTQIELIH